MADMGGEIIEFEDLKRYEELIERVECKRQVLFHKFGHLIFHKKRQLNFHTYLVFIPADFSAGLFLVKW